MAQFDWQIRPEFNRDASKSILDNNETTFSSTFLRLCSIRGITSSEELIEKTNQKPQLYHDPFLLFEMDKTIERIQKAIEEFEPILIYGDYDADGITSTLVMYETLETIGANVHYYLPNRLTDGYGPNKARWSELVNELDIRLIITVDNGVAGFEAVDAMNDIGVDCIITDHHELQSELPNAFSIIHPKHPSGQYPFPELSGAGVALKVVSALLGEVPTEAVELAAIGTVADMVSLTDENRTIVLSGLTLIKDSMRVGLQLLLQNEKVNLDNLTSETIGFIIGPRLNAVGRLGDPTPGLELLKTLDISEAESLLEIVNEKNRERKSITENITIEIENRMAQYDSIPNIIIEADKDWPAGVLGIAASRLVKKYQRPAIVFQYIEEKKQYKGSSRSVSKINIFEELVKQNEYLTHFGGHSQAAGLTIDEENWEDFKQSIHKSFEHYTELLNEPEPIVIDMPLSVNEMTIDFINEVNLLGPFGTDNPKPQFMVKDAHINTIRFIGADKNHVKLALKQTNSQAELQAIGFGKAEQAEGLENGSVVSVVGELDINEWNGNRLPQLMLKDMGVNGSQWLDYRSSKIHKDLLSIDKALYVFSHQPIADYMTKQLNGAPVVLYENVSEVNLAQYNNLIVMEPPIQLQQLKEIVNAQAWSKVYLGSFVQESKYMAGIPTREEFINLYKYVFAKQEFTYKTEFESITKSLNLHPVKLKGMFLMFLEAEFVTIKNGRLEFNKDATNNKIDLPHLKTFIQYESEYKSEALLNYQPLDAIKDYFEGN